MQGNKLYVGGIPYRSTEDDLKKAFGVAGNVVSASIISDRMTGRSRGFGFVEMATAEEADGAAKKFNGQVVDGRTLKMEVANSSGSGRTRSSGGAGSGGVHDLPRASVRRPAG